MFIPTEGPHLWDWSPFMRFFDIVEPLLAATRGNKVIDVTQTRKTGIKINPRPMAWTRKNMEKWAHHSPLTEKFSNELDFRNFQLWCPGEQVCLNESQPPDVFISLSRAVDLKGEPEGNANQRLTFAVAQDLFTSEGELVESIVREICKVGRPLACFELNSNWVIKKNDGCTSSIRILREFFTKDWNRASIPSADMFDIKDGRFELVACYKVIDGIVERRLNFDPS